MRITVHGAPLRARPHLSWHVAASVLVYLTACASDSDNGPMNPTNEAPVIERFEVEPGGGLPIGGGEVALYWQVTGADTVTIDQDIGEVDGNETMATVGQSTLFTLTATNDQGTVQESALALVASDGPPLLDRTARTAVDQIEEAVAEGELDTITALRYKAFALFGDTRLPPEFDADGRVHGSPILFELAQRFDDLPSEVQDELQPFRLPPTDPNSWYAAGVTSTQPARKGIPLGPFDPPSLAAGGRVSIELASTLTEAQKAGARVVVAQAAARSYPMFAELTGRTPTGNGSDPSVYPVYVIADSRSDYGWTNPTTELPGGGWRTNIVINLNTVTQAGASSDALTVSDYLSATVAHELFHAFQFAYDFDVEFDSGLEQEDATTWLQESTATWAEDFVYPELDTEHEYLAFDPMQPTSVLELPYVPLDDLRSTYEYSGYLFHLYLTRTLGDNGVIPAFWDAHERLPAFAAIDEVLGGQFVDWYTDFAVAMWNDGNIDKYRRWDGIDEGVARATEGMPLPYPTAGQTTLTAVNVDRTDHVVDPATLGVRNLSAQYQRLAFSVDNPRSILVGNGFNFDLRREAPTDLPVEYEGDSLHVLSESFTEIRNRNLRTMLLVKSQGEWTGPYDVTTVPFIAFCQDLPEESVEELVFIFVNADYENREDVSAAPRGLPPVVLGSNIACGRWEGSALGNETATPAPGNPDLTLSEFIDVTIDPLVFGRDPIPLEERVRGAPTTTLFNYQLSAFLDPSYRFDLIEAEVEWTVTYAQSSPGDSCSGEGSITLDETQLFGSLWTYNHFLPNDRDYRTHLIDVGSLNDVTYDVMCTASEGGQRGESFVLSNLNGEPLPIEDDGASILGTFESTTEAGTAIYLEQWSWDLFSAPPQE